jgi:GTP-binding protein
MLKKGLVLGINKWDLLEKETNTARDYEAAIKKRLATLEFVPVVTISAMTKQRVRKLLDKVLEVDAERHKRISTAKLNDWLAETLARQNPPLYRNQRVKINYVTQVRSGPPVFQFFSNYPKGIREPYRRYLENRIREAFGFEGVPLKLVFKQK